ncbi:MAG: methylated-DNA--[protein]-cysteine S-methyltransferase [Candidatus Micrarchaeales archaeon]
MERYHLTDFEKKVLLKTFDIPRGTTISYKQLAKMSGSQRAYRAVGNIMNKNPLPIIIPCHRVVASGHKLGGYAYGTTVKRILMRIDGAKP